MKVSHQFHYKRPVWLLSWNICKLVPIRLSKTCPRIPEHLDYISDCLSVQPLAATNQVGLDLLNRLRKFNFNLRIKSYQEGRVKVMGRVLICVFAVNSLPLYVLFEKKISKTCTSFALQ